MAAMTGRWRDLASVMTSAVDPARDRNPERAAHRAAEALPRAGIRDAVEQEHAAGPERVRAADDAADVAGILHADQANDRRIGGEHIGDVLWLPVGERDDAGWGRDRTRGFEHGRGALVDRGPGRPRALGQGRVASVGQHEIHADSRSERVRQQVRTVEKDDALLAPGGQPTQPPDDRVLAAGDARHGASYDKRRPFLVPA